MATENNCNEKNWPFFGVLHFKNEYFKLSNKSKTAFVDVPNNYIMAFLNEFNALSKVCGNDADKLLQEALALEDKYNGKNNKPSSSGFLKFEIYPPSCFSEKKKRSVRVVIDFPNLPQTLDNFAKSPHSLETKYWYLSLCRSSLNLMKSKPEDSQMKTKVKKFAKPEKQKIDDMITKFIADIEALKEGMRERFYVREHLHPQTCVYLSEIITTFRVMKFCVHEGTISTCYREMRKMLESLSWAMFDDLLLFKKVDSALSLFKDEPSPYRRLSQKWYDLSGNWYRLPNKRRVQLRLTSVKELNQLMEKIYDSIVCLGKKWGCNWSKEDVKKAFFSNLTYPLFLFFAGTIKQVPPKLEDEIPQYDTNKLVPIVREDLETMIIALKGSDFSADEKDQLAEFLHSLIDKMPKKIPALYPTNEFVLEIVEQMTDLNLTCLYDSYCYFVHSYAEAWQLFPFSSVFEFKILKYELSTFVETVSKMLDSYLRQLPSSATLSFRRG